MLNPQPGDFGLVSIKGGVGKLIRIGQWLNGDGFRDYEHAFIYIGNNKIIEAEPGGARIADLYEYDGRTIMWSTGVITLTTQQRQEIVEDAVKLIGTPYSFLDYLAIGLYRLGISGFGVSRRVIASEHLICSQLVAQVFAGCGNPLTNYPYYLVTPGRLADYLLSFRHIKRLGKMVQKSGSNSINIQIVNGSE